jgi:ATP-dependent DNA helicase RecG
MKPSISTLRKYFRLEAERKYDNKAVLGGLESMLQTWEAEARADELDEALARAIVARLRDYGRLSPDSREEALKGLWQRIQREVEVGDEKPKAPAKSKTQPKSNEAPRTENKPPAKTGSGPKAEDKVPAPAAPKKERPAFKKPEGPAAALDASVTVLDGIGPKNAENLERLGIRSLRDMLYHFPRRYDDYSQFLSIRQLKYGDEVTVIGTVRSMNTRSVSGGKAKIAEAVIDDETAALRVSWFNQPWMAKNLSEGDAVVLSGKVDQYLGRLTMNNPEWEPLEREQLHTKRIVPVYPLTADVGQRWLRGMMNKVVSYWAPRVDDPLPTSLIDSAQLMPLGQALTQMHFPDSWDDLGDAQQRLAYDELFLLQLAVLQQKRAWQGLAATRFEPPQDWLEGQLGRLPYALTGAQRAALQDIQADLNSGRPMNRLLQGDVGSGKTVVAALGMAMVAQQGAQAAIMAPTSILAEQHYQSLIGLLAGDGGPISSEQIRLMVGATLEAEKTEIRDGLASGQIKMVVGTHTLIEDPVLFAELEMVVIDEQHRFGVQQRAALRAKGSNPHLLVMTATPIPRSLALTVYGDLDLSVIDELPPGRQEVGTHLLLPRERERAYSLIRSQVETGRQAFIIYPLVDGDEENETKAAVQQYEHLQKEVFPNFKLALMHGRLAPQEKEENMTRFRDGAANILVSTSVVEVGVDVPNAVVMLIEGANRFGLAQLHQFRGRVGRGADKSYCILIPEHDEAAENERLKAMTETNDGFALAERDLEQRGPGEFLGIRQSGFADLQLASLTDSRLIDKVRRDAQVLLESDQQLEQSEHRQLAVALNDFWTSRKGEPS